MDEKGRRSRLLEDRSRGVPREGEPPPPLDFDLDLDIKLTRFYSLTCRLQENYFGFIQPLPSLGAIEAPQGKTRNVHLCEFLVTDICSLGEMIKFSINKRYNGKARGFLNNQQLKYPTQVKNTFFKLCFSIFAIV